MRVLLCGENYLGSLSYNVLNDDGCEYCVCHKKSGKHYIERFDPVTVHVRNANIHNGLPISEALPAFDSFIKACRFLKENIDRIC